LRISGDIFADFQITKEKAVIKKLLAPLKPTCITGIGLNYKKHAEESGMKIPQWPVVFMKTPDSVQNPNDTIIIPRKLASEKVDYECELAVIIGKTCKNVTKDKALNYVLGYTCANDVSARDWQFERGSSQWTRSKMFDTFAPLGPWLVTTDEITKPNDLKLRTILNGTVVQDSNTRDMIFTVAELIEFLSGSTTLSAGTVIMTGTPQGVGMGKKPPSWLKPGDIVTIEIEKIGSLTNTVETEKL